jgi:hypothetical protein
LGYVTADAIANRIKQWQASHIGRMRIICIVLRNGKPLAGARVEFVPERFLGDNVRIALGETNDDGVATMKSGSLQDGLIGVAPGFYRVEITKPGTEIPSKYNTATVLGIEVAIDSEGIRQETVGGKVCSRTTFDLSWEKEKKDIKEHRSASQTSTDHPNNSPQPPSPASPSK